MKTAVCTISTKSHLFKSYALLESVKTYSNADLFCLTTDTSENPALDFIHHSAMESLRSPQAERIKQRYKNNPDKLRWALKPVYLKYLIESGYDRVIYVDNDIFFYASPDFLFEKLETATLLLTPHFYKAHPNKDQNWLEANFRVGLYNAGFIGAGKNALPILDWWIDCCTYNVKKAYWRGLFDDQKYLDLIPVLFDHVEIIKHRGCNFAGWNDEDAIIQKTDRNELLINKDPLIFIHFAQLSIERFSQKKSLVHDAFNTYLSQLQKHNPGFTFQSKKLNTSSFSTYFYYLRWKFVRLFESKLL